MPTRSKQPQAPGLAPADDSDAPPELGDDRETAPRERRPTEIVASAGKDHFLVQRFRLVVVSGPSTGQDVRSSSGRVVIGSDESADLIIADRAVSKFHCEIVLDDGVPMVRDLGSRNGTCVDGVQVVSAYLRSSSTLTVGRSQVSFDLGTDHVKIPLSNREQFGTLVGRSPPMRAVFALLERAAVSDATVLLEGETGTGKEAAAESIHRESARKDGPFVVVDCGAIPPDLLEAELFGNERGASVSALTTRQGAFESAAGGTIFLDEIAELSSELQPKLLRVIERKEIKRIGDDTYRPINVRVLAATNRSLRSEVNARRFRSDLYYRLAVLEVRMPPLRERTEDVPILIDSILADLDALDRPESALVRSPEFLSEIARHPWPGNVRELRNYVERCLALHERTPLRVDPAELDHPIVDVSQPLKDARETWTRHLERRYLEEILRRHGNNVTAAARAAGVDRIYFYRLLWRHGLR